MRITSLLLATAVVAGCGPAVRARASVPQPDVDRGIELYNSKNFQEAASVLEAATQASPGNAKALTYLGLSRLELQQHGSAEEAFRKALEADPNYAQAHYRTGSCPGIPRTARQGDLFSATGGGARWEQRLRALPPGSRAPAKRSHGSRAIALAPVSRARTRRSRGGSGEGSPFPTALVNERTGGSNVSRSNGIHGSSDRRRSHGLQSGRPAGHRRGDRRGGRQSGRPGTGSFLPDGEDAHRRHADADGDRWPSASTRLPRPSRPS